MERPERAAVFIFLASVGVAVAAAAVPLALPDLPRTVWLTVFLFGVLFAFLSIFFLSREYLHRLKAQRMMPLIGMLISGVFFVGFSIWYFWPVVTFKGDISISQTKASSALGMAQGGKGGGGEIFGNHGTIVGGRGGRVGIGGTGRGGDGGGGVIHGNGGIIIGGEGGSVDGANIWYPPAQSGFIQYLESQGQTPDFNVQYPGAGGATREWSERQQIVVKIRQEYFRQKGQEAKLRSSKIEDVPLRYINERLRDAGYPWRASIDKKYWYLYYVP